jgi:hypothetical protein
MGRWTRDELENAFANFQKVALHAGTTGDWAAWADLFAEDATYIESNYGQMGGRAAIKKWIVETMTSPPANDMIHFPIEWYIIDEDRGWITCQVWNRMKDPGDGSIHQAYNFTLLKYAGDGLWAYEEDIYDPKHFTSMMVSWFEAKKKLDAAKA